MRRIGVYLATLFSTLFLCAAGYAATPALKHVVVVAFENKSYSEVVSNPVMPYLNSLISSGGLATNFWATAPGSVPDYFMLTTGQTISFTPTIPTPVTVDNLARALNGAEKSWKVYAQSIPSEGYLGPSVYPYIKFHNPFVYFSDVIDSPEQAAKIVPLKQLAADVASDVLPNFSFIVPDNLHNAHDCPDGGTDCTEDDKLAAADEFLADHMPALLNTTSFHDDGMLVIWWDEGTDSENGGGHVAITLVGPVVKSGFRSTVFYRHENVLRTIVEGLQLGSYPGASATATSMTDLFSVPAAPLDFTLSSTPNTVTVTAGQSATYSIKIQALNGSFTSTPALSCTGVPADASCEFSTPLANAGDTSLTANLTVTTTARTTAFASGVQRGTWYLTLIFPLFGYALLPGRRRQRGRMLRGRWRRHLRVIALCFVLAVMVGALVSCGGVPGGGVKSGGAPGSDGSPPAPTGTAAGTYTIQLTAATDAFTRTANVGLVVQ
ncbi:MAG: alkaline phosphatase family protein [Terriglobales bacterium]